ncbi:hypothetical protein GCM10017620_30040 [Brevundimonas intermedia]|uniref:Uncharacterized protein n=1 Tax=Brevundimonas intermedia TaxID=74315 RepID=A0ABQ5TDJ1_9CAUL|nr:hypothetical protein GCM10017620_30040 [Brevundimonas intermedia]
MSQSNSVFQSGLTTWNLPEGDSARQAVAPLRGYVYQLEASLARWLVLPTGSELLLEVAEDYAEVARNPGSLDAVLKATQIKDTRESGAVTLVVPIYRSIKAPYRGSLTGRCSEPLSAWTSSGNP